MLLLPFIINANIFSTFFDLFTSFSIKRVYISKPKPSVLCAICDLYILRKMYLVKATEAIMRVYIKKPILRLFVCL